MKILLIFVILVWLYQTNSAPYSYEDYIDSKHSQKKDLGNIDLPWDNINENDLGNMYTIYNLYSSQRYNQMVQDLLKQYQINYTFKQVNPSHWSFGVSLKGQNRTNLPYQDMSMTCEIQFNSTSKHIPCGWHFLVGLLMLLKFSKM